MKWHTGHKQYRQSGLELYKHSRSLLTVRDELLLPEPWDGRGLSPELRGSSGPVAQCATGPFSLQLRCGAEDIRKWDGRYKKDINCAGDYPERSSRIIYAFFTKSTVR